MGIIGRRSPVWLRLALMIGMAMPAFPQAEDFSVSAKASQKESASQNEEADVTKPKRIFALLPNYRTTLASQPFAPLSTKEKLKLASRDSFDYPLFFISGAWAAVYQKQNRNPTFGQGAEGYGKRYGAAWADQTIANVLSEGVFPAAFHQDPRYFRLGREGGSTWRRMRYSLTRVLITRNDSGKWGFNYSEWAGVGVGVGVSNLYYPSDTLDASHNFEKLGMQVGGDALYNFLREFWPDWQAKLTRRK